MRIGFTVLALAVAGSAHAGPPPPADCTDPDFVRALYQRSDFACATIGEAAVETSRGTVTIRSLKDRPTDTPELTLSEPLYRQAAQEAVEAFDGFDLPVGHVTLFLYPGHDIVVEVGSGRETDAPVPQPMARASPYSESECIVLLPLTGMDEARIADVTPELRLTIAHEIAHCVQAWRWPMTWMGVYASGGWWVEGSADALASAVMPLERLTRAFLATLDAGWAATPLTAFAYETSPLFMWLWREHPDRFDALMRCQTEERPGLGPTRDVDANCLLQTVGRDGLKGFVEAYLSRAIVTPRGEDAAVRPAAGARVEAAGDTAKLTSRAPPLALWRAQLVLTPGRWEIAATGAPELSGRRGTDGWTGLEGTVEIACGHPAEFLLYALPLTLGEENFTVAATRLEAASCGG